jgi:hypothetical protein
LRRLWAVADALEPSIAVQCGELRGTASPHRLWIRWKALMMLGFRDITGIARILDSPIPRQYGPRGFEDGRIFLDSLAAARCRT